MPTATGGPPADVGPQQIHRQVVTVVGGHVQGGVTVWIRKLRVSAEGQQHSSDVNGQWLTALQGSVALGIDGVRQQRHVAEDLVGISAVGQQPGQGLRNTSGLFNRYDPGGEQPLTGSSAPDFRFEDGTRLGELLRQGQAVLLDFSTDRSLQVAAKGWEGRIRYAAGPARNGLGLGAALIRPDGVVAWVAEPAPDPGAFERSAARWFGAPRS